MSAEVVGHRLVYLSKGLEIRCPVGMELSQSSQAIWTPLTTSIHLLWILRHCIDPEGPPIPLLFQGKHNQFIAHMATRMHTQVLVASTADPDGIARTPS
jgi:hypothetical protein